VEKTILAALLAAAVCVVSGVSRTVAQTSAPYPVTTGKVFKFEKIADGVYYATSTGAMPTGSNIPVIVFNHYVLIVDTGNTPAVARALVEDVKTITDKPIARVVNTHFHYDHVDGNQVFAGTATIIAHDYVRAAIRSLDVLNREPYKTSQLTNVPIRIAALERQIGGETDATRKAALAQQLSAARAGFEQLKEITPTPPDMTFSASMLIGDETRDIYLLFLGRGHTPGDTVVFLPKERIVATGDLMESQVAYMGDAIFDEWITTLEALKKLEFDVVLPGHGVPFSGKSKITGFQRYLKDIMRQAADLRKQGVPADEAATRVDLTSHRGDFPEIRQPGAEVRGVRRLYEWLAEQEHKRGR
jgi:glyoxylase-like metal-dependent hydrolase (beta-lactamase superfamily II)